VLPHGDRTRAALRGHPLLIEFWTFDCSNCRYSRQGLTVIAIHRPELPHERAIAQAVALGSQS